MAAALWAFTLVGADAPLWAAIGAHMLLMCSLGLMMTPLMADSLGALPDWLHSHGSALLATLQQVAGALGAAVFVTTSMVMSVRPVQGVPDAAGIRAGFGLAATIALLAVVMAAFVKPPEPRVLPLDDLSTQ